MDWFKKHVDTVIILGSFAAAVLWMNGRFNEVDVRFSNVEARFSKLEQDMAVMKTVLLMKDIMPKELVKTHEVKE